MEDKEIIEIQCPNCNESKEMENKPKMEIDKDYLFCSKCGLLLRLDWLYSTSKIISTSEFIHKYQEQILSKG